jgi:hypothetical protein
MAPGDTNVCTTPICREHKYPEERRQQCPR